MITRVALNDHQKIERDLSVEPETSELTMQITMRDVVKERERDFNLDATRK